MVRRLVDLVCAAVALCAVAPVLALAAIGIRLSSRGPVLFRARRVGYLGRVFTMYKLRTMHVAGPATPAGGRITGTGDARIFPLGHFLRRAKIDELPQLFNILRGEMAIVGPRPEDPQLVARLYTAADYLTLRVRPGLASPGSLYQYTHGDALLAGGDPETLYAERLLPIKLALDLVYVSRASLFYDLSVILRTCWVIAGMVLRRRSFRPPHEMAEAARIVRARQHAAALVLLACGSVLLGCRDWQAHAAAPRPGGSGDVTLVGAGDIASCATTEDEATAALLDSLPGTVFTAGDNAYPGGTATEFANCYTPSWGRVKARTRPTPGNHEYSAAGAPGYFSYFGAAAGDTGKGYYSYDLAGWHVVALNSNIDVSDTSPQLQWLRQDLTTHGVPCTIAYWHHPRFSSGTTHGSTPRLQPLWQVLYDAGVDLVVNGHEHNYERFAPQTPGGAPDSTSGIREFVVGTGGDAGYPFGTPLPTSVVRESHTSGVLALSLLADRYTWRFVPVAGATFSDAGGGVCHDAPAAAGGPSR